MRFLTILLLLNSSFVFAQQTKTEIKTDESLKVAVGLSAGVYYFNNVQYTLSNSNDTVFAIELPFTSAFTVNCMVTKPVMPRISLVADLNLGYKTYKSSFTETINNSRREVEIDARMKTFSVLAGPQFKQIDAKYPFFVNCKVGIGSNRRQDEDIAINGPKTHNADVKDAIWYIQCMTSAGIFPSSNTSVELFFLLSILKDEYIFRYSIIGTRFKSNSQVYGIRFSYLLRD